MCKEVTSQMPEAYEQESQFEIYEDMTSSSLGDDLEKELNGFISTCQEYSLACRLKVYFLGDTNAGKSSLVQSLATEEACLAKKPTQGINHCTWRPFKGSSNDTLLGRKPSMDEMNLSLDLWDMTGRKACQGIHQMFLSRSLFVLVFNLVDSSSYQHLPKYINAVQAKVPGSPMLLVGTRADKLFTKEDRKQKADETLAGVRAAQHSEKEAIKHDITQISDFGADPKLLQQIDWLESLLENRPQIHPSIFVLSCKTGKGLNELRKQLVTMALDCKLFPHTNQTVKPELVRVTELLEELRLKGSLLITWEEYRKITEEAEVRDLSPIEPILVTSTVVKKDLFSNTYLLEMLGALCTFPSLRMSEVTGSPIQYVCTSPQTLASLLCSCHEDDQRKAYRIEARRFWPEGTVRPEAGILVKMLEEIPQQGVIRDVLLPILWQEKTLPEDQIKRIIDLLMTSGLFVCHPTPPTELLPQSDHTNTSSMVSLPNYPNLLQNTRRHAVLMNMITDKRPHLNWSPKPFKGDIQLNWRFSFPLATPPGLTQCMLGAFHTATRSKSYTHHWRYGLLIKLQDAIVCIEVDTVDLYVDVICRVNADDPSFEVGAIEFLWAHLAPFAKEALTYLKQWPGLVFKCELVPFGSCFYQDETIGGDHPFSLSQCLMAAKTGKAIKFTDGGIERSFNAALLLQFNVVEYQTVEDWLSHILEERERVIASRAFTPPLPPPCKSMVKRTSEANLRASTKTKHQVTWDLKNEDNVKTKPSQSIGSEPAKLVVNCTNSDSNLSLSDHSNTPSITENCGTGMMLGEEQLAKEATRVASGFVASVLAQAVADYIQVVHEDNHTDTGKKEVTKSQVEAARLTAEAASAAQSGDIEAAARAVMSAAQALQISSLREKSSVQSKACHIL